MVLPIERWKVEKAGILRGDGRRMLQMDVGGGKSCLILEDHYRKLLSKTYTFSGDTTCHRVLEIRDNRGHRILPLKLNGTFVY